MAAKKTKKITITLDEDYSDMLLLGIQTPLASHRLAYQMNSVLNLKLRRNDMPLVLTKKDIVCNFTTFDYFDEEQQLAWSLIENTYKSLRIDKNRFDLFATDPFYSTRIDYLFPEEKAINYVLKITNIDSAEFTIFSKKIHQIYNVEMVKPLEIEALKNKEKLLY